MENKVLAVVAGKEITSADLDVVIANMPQEQKMYANHPMFREQLLDQVVTQHVLAKFAEEQGLEEREEFAKIMADFARELKANMAANEIVKGIEVTDEVAEEYYNANPAAFEKPATVSAKHILVAEEEVCQAILEAITKGEKTFEEAAKENSTCPSGQRGGDLGEFGRGQMVKEFEEAAFAAEIGHVVGPVKTQFGYHLIKVEAKSEAETEAFAEVKEGIKQKLLQEKHRQAFSAKVMELKAQYVEMN